MFAYQHFLQKKWLMSKLVGTPNAEYFFLVNKVSSVVIKSAGVDFTMLKLQCTAKVENYCWRYLVVTINFSFLR